MQTERPRFLEFHQVESDCLIPAPLDASLIGSNDEFYRRRYVGLEAMPTGSLKIPISQHQVHMMYLFLAQVASKVLLIPQLTTLLQV